MTYSEKRNLANMATMALVYAAYAIYAFPRYSSGTPLRTWAVAMLVFMGVMVVAAIIIQGLFHVLLAVGAAVGEAVREGPNVDGAKIDQSIRSEMVEDERDRLISLKATRVGTIVNGSGFFLGLVTLVLGFTPALMLNIMFGAIFLGSFVEGIVNIIITRRGV